MNEYTPIVVALVAAAGSVYAVWQGRKKQNADAIDTLVDATNKLSLRIERLEKRDEIFRKRERVLWDYINELRDILAEHNIEAKPLPDLPKLED